MYVTFLIHYIYVISNYMKLGDGDTRFPEGSLFMDCPDIDLTHLVALAMPRDAWNTIVNGLTLHH